MIENVVTNAASTSFWKEGNVNGRKTVTRLRAEQYNPADPSHHADPNVVVKVRLARGEGTLAINVLEAIVSALRIDGEAGIVYLESLAAANRAQREAGGVGRKTTTARPAAASIPMNATPEQVREILKRQTAARLAALAKPTTTTTIPVAASRPPKPTRIATSAIPVAPIGK